MQIYKVKRKLLQAIWVLGLLYALLSFLPAFASADEEPADYSFTWVQGDPELSITTSDTEAIGNIYFYTIDGNQTTHIYLEVGEAPEGWTVTIDPPLHEQDYFFDGEGFTIIETISIEQTEVYSEPITDVRDGMVSYTLSDHFGEGIDGYCLAKVAMVTITLPQPVTAGTTGDVEIYAQANWIREPGGADIAYTRDFNFTVTVLDEASNGVGCRGAVGASTTEIFSGFGLLGFLCVAIIYIYRKSD